MEPKIYGRHLIKTSSIYLSILTFSIKTTAQNLPSLILDKNINATFSILAYDKKTQEWGIAVATNNIYVGNSTIYIEPGTGAFSIIAETEPLYAENGFKNLKSGMTIQESIESTKSKDKEFFYRQVSGLDANGNAFAFTGQALKYWKGTSAHIIGDHYVIMGNQLADNVLENMQKIFLESNGTLAERLLKTIISGQNKGGQIQGKQSAALVVKGTNNEWYNQIDLRVDNSNTPFEDLQKLLNYHYGRIRINQAVFAIKNNNKEKGLKLLIEAKQMIEGWNGIYPKIVIAYLLLNDEETAVQYILKGLKENPNWKEYLSAFYCLKKHPAIKDLIIPEDFTEKDWINATSTLLVLGKEQDAFLILKNNPNSQLYTIFAKYYQKQEKINLAKENIKMALLNDPENEEARVLYELLNK